MNAALERMRHLNNKEIDQTYCALVLFLLTILLYPILYFSRWFNWKIKLDDKFSLYFFLKYVSILQLRGSEFEYEDVRRSGCPGIEDTEYRSHIVCTLFSCIFLEIHKFVWDIHYMKRDVIFHWETLYNCFFHPAQRPRRMYKSHLRFYHSRDKFQLTCSCTRYRAGASLSFVES